MKQNSHQRHCLNGHVVEDEELNFCPVCGMPLYDQLQSDDSNNLEAQFNRFEPDESSRHNKNNIGYIILSTVIVVLIFIILELMDVTYLIPHMHKKVQIEQIVKEVIADMKTQENNVREAAEAIETKESNADEIAVMVNAIIEQSTESPAIQTDTLLYYNPYHGNLYHADPYCLAVNKKYWPLQAFPSSEINQKPYDKLRNCHICLAPSREEIEAKGPHETNTDEVSFYEINGL